MKRFFTFFVSFLLLTSARSLAQSQTYWSEGFENTTGNLNSQSAQAPTTPAVDTADNGVWVLFEAYRTASNPPTCANFGAGHIRLLKLAVQPWVATPDLAFGINTISLGSASTTTGKVFTLQYTTGTFSDQDAAGVAGATWTTFAKFKVQSCGDTTVTLNNPLARRIRFIADTSIAYQDDLDSVSITSTTAIVPVKFTGINANYNNGLVKLSWNNETEINTSAYFIERSVDGKNFSSVGTVSATNVRNYGWYDNAPVSGISYYRIKAVDKNGLITYSSIVRISAGSQASEIIVSPNPVRGRNLSLQLNNLVKGNYTVNIFNSNSQKVFTTTVNHNGGNSVQTLSLPSIGKGFYNVHVTNGSANFTKSIVVE